MSNVSCFIIEDDPQALAYASSIIRHYGNVDIIGNSGNITEAADQVKKLRPDFILLDVFLEDGNAFEFLALFDEIDFRIIFTTSYAEYAIDAFRFSALDYLLKPYEEKELILALDKVLEEIHKSNDQTQLHTLLYNLSNKDQPKKLVLKNAEAIHVVDINNILYAKSDNNYTTFLLDDGKEVLVSKPIKSFEKKLSSYNFFRVHQRFLINRNHISSFDKRNEEVILKQAHAIPVAQSRKKDLIEYIDRLF